MESIKDIYRIGYGPSSSHTMGPRKAVADFLERITAVQKIIVTLYGSLAATGRGHMTDVAILDEAGQHGIVCDIVWKPEELLPGHPNGLVIEAHLKGNGNAVSETFYSIGGGKIVREGESYSEDHIYPLQTMKEILDWCDKTGQPLWEYVLAHEKQGVFDYLREVWEVMKQAVKNGLAHEGVLPGGLLLPKKAAQYYSTANYYSGPI
nr:serine dehydratase [Spirochaetales bacterium]